MQTHMAIEVIRRSRKHFTQVGRRFTGWSFKQSSCLRVCSHTSVNHLPAKETICTWQQRQQLQQSCALFSVKCIHCHYVYGDSAYSRLATIISPYTEHEIAALRMQRGDFVAHRATISNSSLKRVRIAIEWVLDLAGNLFRSLRHKDGLRLKGMKVGDVFHVCMTFCNAWTCFRGSQISKYLECQPTSLHEWLNSNKQLWYSYQLHYHYCAIPHYVALTPCWEVQGPRC